MLRKELLEVRDYQVKIAESSSKRNTLVVLPTGMGKTIIAIIVSEKRMEKFPEKKILMLAPTRPLVNQHKKTYEKFTYLEPEKILSITGKIPSEKRKELYEKGKIIISTPQTIKNDMEKNYLSLNDFSLVIFDEAHRAVKDYAYPFIAKRYSSLPNSLILGLTASPGGSEERIKEICENLKIKHVEIRTERDEDVAKYVKKIEKEFVYVDFPESFKVIQNLVKNVIDENLEWLKENNFINSSKPKKSELIKLQEELKRKYEEGKESFFIQALIKVSNIIKLEHSLELLESQGISFFYDYFKELRSSSKKTDKILMKNSNLIKALELAENLLLKKVEHPKILKVVELIKNILKIKPEAKIIVFANLRSTVEKICSILNQNSISSKILVGQARRGGKKGLSQKEQISVLKEFEENKFNVLCGTSISEEGLDLPKVDYAIFYEAVPSEIRAIQRRGRVGRQSTGKIIFLLTKGTRDESYYWSAFHKEKRMKSILYNIKKRLKRDLTLIDFISG